jgi:aromatic-L-amino-acid decarboxylase
MSPDDFRALGHRMVDWIADYWKRAEEFPVLARVKPGETAAKLPAMPPQTGGPDSWDQIFDDLDRVVLPGLTHWQSPNFFGYFPANASGPAVLGELLSAGLGVQGMLWSTSPACTEIETRMLDWLAAMLALPEKFLSTSPAGGGVIQGTASEATLVAMLAARARSKGQDLVAYASNQAHSSVVKAAMIAGIAHGADDREHVRLIDVDQNFAIAPDALAAAVRDDLSRARTPFFVCATVGTTGTTAIDPIEKLADALRDAGFNGWLHVDAAHAGAACICPEFRGILNGIQHADSFCFNPHKWLLTNFDCGCFWTSDRRSLTDALSVTPEYLRNAATDSGRVIDYRDWQIPLGRRFRALKLWFVIRHYGVEGLRAYIREHVRLAETFENLVKSDPRFELCAPRVLNLVCLRLRGAGPESDTTNRRLMDRLNNSGKLFLTHTALPPGPWSNAGRLVLRMAIGAAQTQEKHVRDAWEEMVRQADLLQAEGAI